MRTAPRWLLPVGGGIVLLVLIAGLILALMRPAFSSVAAATSSQGYPKRIVSLNPCLDPVLVRVADRSQIAAISHYSHDAETSSTPAGVARRFAVTSGTAEEVLAMRPDLVIAGPHVALPTILALRRLGIPLKQWPVPATLDDNRQQIAELSAVVGGDIRGQALNDEIDAAIARAQPNDNRFIPALIWQSGGLVPGQGTLADELLQTTGFRNLSDDYGLATWDILPLEKLVANPPRVLFSNSGSANNGDRMLSHPVLAKLGDNIQIRQFPSRLLQCAGPNIIEAVHVLATIRHAAGQRP